MLNQMEKLEYERKVRLECIRTTGRRPISVAITEIDEDTAEVSAELSPSCVARTRRITGYLSEQANWNSAKQAELADRKTHTSVGSVAPEAAVSERA